MKKLSILLIVFFCLNLYGQFSFHSNLGCKPLLLEPQLSRKSQIYEIQLSREFQVYESYIYDWLEGDWSNQLKSVYNYNALNQMSQINVYYWTGSVWGYDHREIYTYDENENIIEVLIQIHDGGWINLLLYTVSYNINNEITELLIQNWVNLQWQNFERTLISYDANDFKIEELHQYWTNDWWDDIRYSYTNDEQGNILEILQENMIGSNWVEYYLTLFSYDTDFNILTQLGQFNSSGTWVNDILNTFEYDSNDNMISDLEQYWFMDEWWNNNFTTYTFDDNENLIEILQQEWGNDEWMNDALTEHLYQEVEVHEDQIHIANIKLWNYPNPFNPATEIRFQTSDFVKNEATEIEIYNLKGQIVKTIPVILSPSTQLRTALVEGSVWWNGTDNNDKPVSSGVYFYKLKVGTTEITKKMLLTK